MTYLPRYSWAFALSCFACAAVAQDDICQQEGIECLTEPTVIASGEGGFVGVAALDLGSDADAVAALEQQALREFRWDVLEPVRLQLSLETVSGTLPSAWPSDVEIGTDAVNATLLVSNDGETFAPLPSDTVVAAGQIIAVLVRQKSDQPTEDSIRFYPTSWTYELIARPIAPQVGPTLGPVIIPIAFGDNLGCETPGCGEGAEEGAAPNVTGDPDATPAAGGGDTCDATGANDLARELQSELARVGCYAIAIDGLWGPGSRKAMSAFNAATQSELPVNNPTPGALVAVAKETGTVCGG